MTFQLKYVWPFAVMGSLACGSSWAQETPQLLQEVVVTATLRDIRAIDLPQSLTVLDNTTLQNAGVQQL